MGIEKLLCDVEWAMHEMFCPHAARPLKNFPVKFHFPLPPGHNDQSLTEKEGRNMITALGIIRAVKSSCSVLCPKFVESCASVQKQNTPVRKNTY